METPTDSAAKFGYISPNEYITPFRLTIFYENTDINCVIAAAAHAAQSLELPQCDLAALGNIAQKFKYFSPDVLVLSPRFTSREFDDLFARGFQRIIVCDDVKIDNIEKNIIDVKNDDAKIDNVKDKSYEKNNIISTSYEDLTNHVKLANNAYRLYDNCLAIRGDCAQKAAIAHRLKCFKCGMMLGCGDDISFCEMLKLQLAKLNFVILFDEFVTRGQAFYDISEIGAKQHIDRAKLVKVCGASGNRAVAAIVGCDAVARDALIEIAPLDPRLNQAQIFIYCECVFDANEWLLSARCHGASAHDILCGIATDVIGDINRATGKCSMSEMNNLLNTII